MNNDILSGCIYNLIENISNLRNSIAMISRCDVSINTKMLLDQAQNELINVENIIGLASEEEAKNRS